MKEKIFAVTIILAALTISIAGNYLIAALNSPDPAQTQPQPMTVKLVGSFSASNLRADQTTKPTANNSTLLITHDPPSGVILHYWPQQHDHTPTIRHKKP